MTRKLAVIVTGGRNYVNADLVNAALDVCRPDLVLHGDATGADRLAQRWCNDTETPYVAYPAQWDILGKVAGPKRNGDMCDDLLKYRRDGYRIGVIAFPGNSGTASCITHAERRGIRVWYPASDPHGAEYALRPASRNGAGAIASEAQAALNGLS